MRIRGRWAYWYRAVDKAGQTVDFLLTPHRERAAAEAFLRKAIRPPGLPETITIEKSGAKSPAIAQDHKIHKTAIAIGHSKSLKNLVEQEDRAGKRKGRPRVGVKSVGGGRGPIVGIEVRQALRKGQLPTTGSMPQTPAEQLSALAAAITESDNSSRLQLKFATKPFDAFNPQRPSHLFADIASFVVGKVILAPQFSGSGDGGLQRW